MRNQMLKEVERCCIISRCKSSRNRASGCVSLRANTPRKRRKDHLEPKVLPRPVAASQATGGCFPITSSSSGTAGSTMICPFRPQRTAQASLLPATKLLLALGEAASGRPGLGRLLATFGSHRGCRVCTDRTCRTLNRPRGGNSTSCIPLTIEDLPDTGISGHQHKLPRCRSSYNPDLR